MALIPLRNDPRWHDCRLHKGGGSSQSQATTTSNQDKRNAVQDGVAVSGDGAAAFVEFNDPDAVKAIAQAGADVLQNVGGAVVDLNRDSIAAQTKSFDALVKGGVELVDKVIGANMAQAERVVSAYKPVDGANADVAKWGTVAAGAAVVAALLMKR